MICDSCKIDRLVNDFVNKSNICYKCVYQEKLEKMGKKRTRKVNFCRMCGKEVIHKENFKKRQRTVFCSCECAEKGHKELINNHWTRIVRSADF
jgi:hypothetical protein